MFSLSILGFVNIDSTWSENAHALINGDILIGGLILRIYHGVIQLVMDKRANFGLV